MKAGKIVVASVVLTIFDMIVGAITCGGIFNWVYKLEPTHVWLPMDNFPIVMSLLGGFLLNIIFVCVYSILKNGLPGKNNIVKGLNYGFFVWAIGMLPGMLSTHMFMTVATMVVIYWTVLGAIQYPLRGLVIAAICGE